MSATGKIGRTTRRGSQAINAANRATPLLWIGRSSAAAFGKITDAVSSGDLGVQRQFQLALKLVV